MVQSFIFDSVLSLLKVWFATMECGVMAMDGFVPEDGVIPRANIADCFAVRYIFLPRVACKQS